MNISGLQIVKAAVPLVDLTDAVRQIDDQPWSADSSRKVQRYGFAYAWEHRELYSAGAFLSSLQDLAQCIQENGWMRPKPDQVSVLSFDRNSYLDAHIDDTACFGQEIVTVSLVSSALYWLTDGTYAEAHIVEPGDVVVLRGEARYKYKHGVAKPKLNEKLDAGVTRLITDRGAPRLELGVGHRGKMRGVVFRLPSALLFRLALCRALDPEMCMSGSSLA